MHFAVGAEVLAAHQFCLVEQAVRVCIAGPLASLSQDNAE
jgi:hypothetical protein